MLITFIISFPLGIILKGENSVVVEILENTSGRNFENNRTVVSHKKYVVFNCLKLAIF
ncbi:DUF2187 family protein [Bacillus sp. AFS037270]|uniref:DUF2187 family protein n=1 Tax=Bacillus sp. AFS037270 TaxID=2033499 RepID=UPI000BFB7ED3|nr:hypothetical protein COD92_07260 [Bacillus sp. AFS037270]